MVVRPSWVSNWEDFSYFLSTSHPDASYKSPWCFLPSFNWPFSSGEEAKVDFQEGHHSGRFWFLIGTILAIFDLQITLMLPIKFQVNWLFGSGEEAKNRFSSWILDLNYISYFWSTKSPQYFLPSFKSVGLLVREKKIKKDVQDGGHSGHLGFWIGTNLAVFDLLVTQMHQTKFQVNLFNCSGGGVENVKS